MKHFWGGRRPPVFCWRPGRLCVSHLRRPGRRRRSWRWGCFALNGVAFAMLLMERVPGGRVIKGCCIRWWIAGAERARGAYFFVCDWNFFVRSALAGQISAAARAFRICSGGSARPPPKTHALGQARCKHETTQLSHDHNAF